MRAMIAIVAAIRGGSWDLVSIGRGAYSPELLAIPGTASRD